MGSSFRRMYFLRAQPHYGKLHRPNGPKRRLPAPCSDDLDMLYDAKCSQYRADQLFVILQQISLIAIRPAVTLPTDGGEDAVRWIMTYACAAWGL